MSRWQVMKDGRPLQLLNTYEEAEDVAIEWDADDIREIEDDAFE